jgi:hypothetical protein
MALRFALPLILVCFAQSAWADDFAPMALNSIGAVPPKIAGAPVKDAHGALVGQVTKIETDGEGKPLRADGTLSGGRMVFLDTASLSYDENANLLVTSLDQQQLAQLASQRNG